MKILFSLLLAQSFFHNTTHKVTVLPILCIKIVSFEILGKDPVLRGYACIYIIPFPS